MATTTDPTDIVIPAGLLPADGRFGCGPSRVPQNAIDALASMGSSLLGTSHRQAPVRDQVGRLQDGLRALFDVPDDHDVLLAVGGATAFWDMATFGLVRARSQHYTFGEFSSKFAAAAGAAPWLADPVLVNSEPGTRPELVAAGDGVDVQALTHNETATGVMMDLTRPDGTGPADPLVLVDATSGAGGLPVTITDTDVYYFSLQKGFASEGGLVVAITSPRAAERIEQIASSDRHVPAILDLVTALSNSRKRQTYNTPSISTVVLAAEQVDAMNAAGGLGTVVAAGREKAAALYGWAESRAWASPYVADPAARSLVVGTVDLDADVVDGDAVAAALRANGVVDSEPYRKLGRNQVRVGMFPAVPLADVEAYTACVDHVVGSLAG